MRLALVETATGKVTNVIKAAGTWQAPPGYFTIEAAGASPGDLWDGVKFVPRPLTPEETAAEERARKIIEAKDRFLTTLASQTSPPWSNLLKDLAVVLGLKEPE